jgi:pimeloyl-[acyl-carrier protein] methyl ester esterase
MDGTMSDKAGPLYLGEMTNQPIRIILLPGLHGTAELFEDFVAAAPPGFQTEVMAFPKDRKHSYADLLDRCRLDWANDERPTILLGESFSGPLALELARQCPKGLIGVVLVATFVSAPAPAFLRHLPWSWMFRLRVPIYTIRSFFAYGETGRILRKALRTVREVKAEVLADRLRSTLMVDAREALRECPVPILYLQAKKDWVVGRRSARIIHRLRPDVTFVEIAASHFLLQQNPKAAWAVIEKFAVSAH